MRGEAGFSLIEVMVAIAVFSLGAVALLNALGESQRSQAAVETRAVARIIAENRLVEVMAASNPPLPGEAAGEETALDRTWRWRRTVAATAEPDLLRIDVRVSEGEGEQVVAEASTFRAAR